MNEELNPQGGLAALVREHQAKKAALVEEEQALAALAPRQPAVEADVVKPGIRSTELWLATLLPVIVGAVVQLGWLSEQAATELGMVGGASYVLGRSLVKGVVEWRKR